MIENIQKEKMKVTFREELFRFYYYWQGAKLISVGQKGQEP